MMYSILLQNNLKNLNGPQLHSLALQPTSGLQRLHCRPWVWPRSLQGIPFSIPGPRWRCNVPWDGFFLMAEAQEAKPHPASTNTTPAHMCVECGHFVGQSTRPSPPARPSGVGQSTPREPTVHRCCKIGFFLKSVLQDSFKDGKGMIFFPFYKHTIIFGSCLIL